jgi:hypothetical protein
MDDNRILKPLGRRVRRYVGRMVLEQCAARSLLEYLIPTDHQYLRGEDLHQPLSRLCTMRDAV